MQIQNEFPVLADGFKYRYLQFLALVSHLLIYPAE